jgi:hypothetical protein
LKGWAGELLPLKCKDCFLKRPICQRTIDDIITGEWRQLTAFQENRIYPISCDTICRPGPRLFDGVEKLHRLFLDQGVRLMSTYQALMFAVAFSTLVVLILKEKHKSK